MQLAGDAKAIAFRVDTSINYAAKFNKLQAKMKDTWQISLADGSHISNKDLADLTAGKKLVGSKVVDMLMRHICVMYAKDPKRRGGRRVVIFYTSFVSSAMKAFPKSRACKSKVRFKFLDEVIQFLQTEGGFYVDVDRIYFHFCFERHHWVSVCVDMLDPAIKVLDCWFDFRSTSWIELTFNPLAQMLPNILKQAFEATNLGNMGLRTFVVERPSSIPQIENKAEPVTTMILLTQAHVVNDLQACALVKPDIIAAETQKLAVMLYEEHEEEL